MEILLHDRVIEEYKNSDYKCHICQRKVGHNIMVNLYKWVNDLMHVMIPV